MRSHALIAVFAACVLLGTATAQQNITTTSSNVTTTNTTPPANLTAPAANLTQAYVVPLAPAANDSITFQRTAPSPLLNLLQVEVILGPCAVRLPHFHSTDEFIVVINNTLGFINVEPNNTVTDKQVPAGYVIEQPKGQLHNVYNPTCVPTYYTGVFNGLGLNTYNVPYALNSMGNFTLNAVYSNDGAPMLRYPGIAPRGQWVYEPACLQRCGITLPANLVDVDAKPATSATG